MTHVNTSWLALLDEIRAMATEGLKYVKDPFDEARYERMLEMVADSYAPMLDMDAPGLRKRFQSELGIVTAKLTADAAIVNEDGQVLVLSRADDGSWCLPGGWVDITETTAQGAVREAFEEAGLTVEPLYYIYVSHVSPAREAQLRYQMTLVTFMKPVPSSTVVTLSHEHTDYRWISADDVLTNWHSNHEKLARKIFDFLASDRTQFLPID